LSALSPASAQEERPPYGAVSARSDQDQHKSNTTGPRTIPRAPGPAARAGRLPRGLRVSGESRDSVRQSARPVIELDFGILVYPPETGGEPWRAVFTENGQRKYRQGATEAKLAAKLEKVAERLQADAVRPGSPAACSSDVCFRGDFPGSGKSCNKSNTIGADAPGYSAACSLSGPLPGLHGTVRQARASAPLAAAPRLSGSRAARAGRAAFRDELGRRTRKAPLSGIALGDTAVTRRAGCLGA
jgi:hypothetical protein